MWRELREFLLEVIIPTVLICLFAVAFGAAVTMGVYAVISPRACEATWKERSEWAFWSGCMVQTEHGTVPARLLQYNDLVIREGL